MNATEIRSSIESLKAGNVDAALAALATTGARTEGAREDVRRAIAAREHGVPVTRREGPGGRTSAPKRRAYYAADRRQPDALAAWATCTQSARVSVLRARGHKLALARATARIAPLVEAAYDRCGYRRAEGRWAGGDHSVVITCEDTESATSSTSRAWSSNGKWSGMDSCHRITVRPSWDVAVPEAARVVGGLLTLSASLVSDRIYLAGWVEQGRGTAIGLHHGYLVDSPRGWVHAESMRGARALLSEAPPAPRVKVDLRSLSAEQLLLRARVRADLVVTREIAHDEGRGACYAGIRDWAARHGLSDRETVTAGELAELSVSSGDRVADVYAVLLAARRSARKAA